MRIILSACAISHLMLGCGALNLKKTVTKSDSTARLRVSSADLNDIDTSNFEIEGRVGNDVYIFAKPSQMSQIFKTLPSAIIEANDITSELHQRLEDQPEVTAALYTLDKVNADLLKWGQNYPGMTDLVTYGQSTQGRSLVALRITNKARRDAAPAVMITGATHGNEILTVDTVMGIASHILTNAQRDTRLSHILDTKEVWFVPVVSPDSYVAQTRQVDGVDPNRDYPWPENPSKNATKVIKALTDFFDARDFVATLDYHSVASVVMWPWAYTEEAPSDVQSFKAIAQSMSEANGYRIGQISDVMYIAKGSSADYYYWKKKSKAMAVELSRQFPTLRSSGDDMVRENLESTLRFIENASK